MKKLLVILFSVLMMFSISMVATATVSIKGDTTFISDFSVNDPDRGKVNDGAYVAPLTYKNSIVYTDLNMVNTAVDGDEDGYVVNVNVTKRPRLYPNRLLHWIGLKKRHYS